MKPKPSMMPITSKAFNQVLTHFCVTLAIASKQVKKALPVKDNLNHNFFLEDLIKTEELYRTRAMTHSEVAAKEALIRYRNSNAASSKSHHVILEQRMQLALLWTSSSK
mmetsp:Transcript_20116/g.31532  ORF Transcript_20116/g.31532 Transcript_20116/m.31532 type:complete len:109 (+) Transcript_20116:53-379(+)